MSGSITCPKCGYSNRPSNSFCGNCSAQLEGSQPTVAPVLSQTVRTEPRLLDSVEYDTSINRTKTGLLLVMVGLVLGPIPYVTYIGWVLAVIGVIMVILGRGPFEDRHSSLVVASVVVYCLGFLIVLISGVAFGFSLAQTALTGGSQTTLAQSLIDSSNGLIIAFIVGGEVTSLAYVLFTYGLQNSSGRILLYSAVILGIGVNIFLAYTVSGQVASAVSQSFQGGSFNPLPLTNLRSQLQYFQLLGLLPASIFALSYYGAYRRVSSGEIPREKTS